MPNVIKIGQFIADVIQFFKMSAVAILDFQNSRIFWLTGSGGRDTSPCQISSKLVKQFLKCHNFLLFKMAVAAVLDYRNSQIREFATDPTIDVTLT